MDVDNSSSTYQELETSWKIWKKKRHIVTFMLFLGFVNAYALRVNLSVGIVAMTENRTVHYENGTIGYEQDFSWNSKERGLILSSFFYGYITMQIVGGWLATKFGGCLVFGIGIFVTSLFTLLTPLAARNGVYSFIIVRVIQGIFQSIAYPSIYAILARWAPPLERSRMTTFILAGCQVGTVIATPICGVLAENYGWGSLFYVFGMIGCIWYIFWIVIVREGPEKDKYISKDELQYIQNSLGATQNSDNNSVKYPWKEIFTSKPVYAINAAQLADGWGLCTMLTQLPSFLTDALGFDLDNAAFVAAAPYLTMSIFLFLSGYIADLCQTKGYLTTTQVRRCFNCGGFLIQTVFLMIAAYVMDPIITIISISLFVGFASFSWCGFTVNNLDIAPQYASVLTGISNTVGNIPGIISPTLTGLIVVNSTRDEWQIVFMITASTYVFGCFVYWYWASGEVQSWAEQKQPDVKKQKQSGSMTKFSNTGEAFEMSE